MGTKDKLIERFKRQPKDFTWDELVRLLGIFGFEEDNMGKTSGSEVAFKNGSERILVHKPHPSKIIKKYKMKAILAFLCGKNLIK
jgi:hypothetical protein